MTTTIEIEDRHAILVRLVRRLKEFTEEEVTRAFAREIDESVSPLLEKGVRRALAELTENGLLSADGETFSLRR